MAYLKSGEEVLLVKVGSQIQKWRLKSGVSAAQQTINIINKMNEEISPNIKAAIEAREVVKKLLDGVELEMAQFRAETKRNLEDLRSTRLAIVMETSQISGPLKDLRQFFMNNDYDQERARLKEFVDLCERLQKLKESGFLDSVADTMLKLA